MRVINLVYSIVRKSFEKSQDGGNTYLSFLIMLIWFSFGLFYNILFFFFFDDFGIILSLSFMSSLVTAIILFFYPGFKYEEERIAHLSSSLLDLIATGVIFISLGSYFLSVYTLYHYLDRT